MSSFSDYAFLAKNVSACYLAIVPQFLPAMILERTSGITCTMNEFLD
jgi:hypothetical protein